jgi:hypothetical protein
MTISGIALFLLLAQNAAPQQPAVPAAPASIEGIVTKTATGETLPRVTVTLSEVRSVSPAVAAQLPGIPFAPGSSEYRLLEMTYIANANPGPLTRATMTTTSDGRFFFENLKPGTYSVSATLGGYTPAE